MPFISKAHRESLGEREHDQLFLSHIACGTHPKTGDTLFIPDKDRYSGTYVQGVQGRGKSAHLKNLIRYDVALGHSIIVMDPHGDLVDDSIAQLPDEAIARTIL